MFIYKDAVGFIGNVGVWSDGMGGYVLVDGIHYDAMGNLNIFNLICGNL